MLRRRWHRRERRQGRGSSGRLARDGQLGDRLRRRYRRRRRYAHARRLHREREHGVELRRHRLGLRHDHPHRIHRQPEHGCRWDQLPEPRFLRRRDLELRRRPHPDRLHREREHGNPPRWRDRQQTPTGGPAALLTLSGTTTITDNHAFSDPTVNLGGGIWIRGGATVTATADWTGSISGNTPDQCFPTVTIGITTCGA